MPSTLNAPAPLPIALSTQTDRLRRFLQAYWLRPENALWMTLRSLTLDRVALRAPCLDLCCGDGIFTFLHTGGVLDPDFDVFGGVNQEPAVPPTADMFNHCPADYRPIIERPANYCIDLGCDWKTALLAKAERLSLYRHLVRHDNNQPLPFADSTIQTIYCNAAYWIEKVDGFLGELRRVVVEGGAIILQVKLDSLRRYTLDRFRSLLGDRLLSILDRGRLDCWPTLADRATWERRFRQAGLHIVEATPFITRTHAHLWDIGLRPIAPLLVRMTSALTAATRASIKSDWVDMFEELLGPFCHPDVDVFAPDEPGEIQYVLSR